MSGNGFEFSLKLDRHDDTCEVIGFSGYREAVSRFASHVPAIVQQRGDVADAVLYDFEGRPLFDAGGDVSWSDPLYPLPTPGVYRVEWIGKSGNYRLVPVEVLSAGAA